MNQRAELMTQRAELRAELDRLRQADNKILFDLGNPPDLDAERGKILASMRKVIGQIQDIEKRLQTGGGE